MISAQLSNNLCLFSSTTFQSSWVSLQGKGQPWISATMQLALWACVCTCVCESVHTHHMESTSVGVGPLQGRSCSCRPSVTRSWFTPKFHNLGIKILALQVANCLLVWVSALLSVPSIQLFFPLVWKLVVEYSYSPNTRLCTPKRKKTTHTLTDSFGTIVAYWSHYVSGRNSFSVFEGGENKKEWAKRFKIGTTGLQSLWDVWEQRTEPETSVGAQRARGGRCRIVEWEVLKEEKRDGKYVEDEQARPQNHFWALLKRKVPRMWSGSLTQLLSDFLCHHLGHSSE